MDEQIVKKYHTALAVLENSTATSGQARAIIAYVNELIRTIISKNDELVVMKAELDETRDGRTKRRRHK